MEYALLVTVVLSQWALVGVFWLKNQSEKEARETVEGISTMMISAIERAYERGAAERKSLEDRLMAMFDPDQLQLFDAVTDKTPMGDAVYMDEETEVEMEARTNGSSTTTD